MSKRDRANLKIILAWLGVYFALYRFCESHVASGLLGEFFICMVGFLKVFKRLETISPV